MIKPYEVGHRLDVFLQEAGITKSEIARQTGKKNSQITRMVYGQENKKA